MIRNFFVTLLAAFALCSSAWAAVEANQASQAELETVKGIGPGLSAKILEARKTGAFKDWPDMIDRVPGIGAGNAARYSQAGLTVNNAAFAGAAAATKVAKADKSDKAGAPAKADKAQPAKP